MKQPTRPHQGKIRKTYSEKLKDPRWQRRRLEILERDGWTCQHCDSKDKTLHVHHKWYDGDPWESQDQALETLCEDCHQDETECRGESEKLLLQSLREHLNWYELDWLAEAFEGMPTPVVKALAVTVVHPAATKSTEEWLAAQREKFVRWLQEWEEHHSGGG